MVKYFVEIQDAEDFDNVLIQSHFFSTINSAREWFNKLEWFDRDLLSATIMSCVLNDEGDLDGDILYVEDLTNNKERGV